MSEPYQHIVTPWEPRRFVRSTARRKPVVHILARRHDDIYIPTATFALCGVILTGSSRPKVTIQPTPGLSRCVACETRLASQQRQNAIAEQIREARAEA